MNKIIILLAVALLSFSSAAASPLFKGLNNKHDKTTVKIEIPTSDLSQVTVIKDWKLHNAGKVYGVKKVSVKGREGTIFVLEFDRVTALSDCTLSFTVNGKPTEIDIQSVMNR